MFHVEHALKTMVFSICAFLSVVFGDLAGVPTWLIICIAADYLTGLIVGGKEGQISSKIGFNGLKRKALILIMFGLGHMADQAAGTGNTIRDTIGYFYMANELISITENAVRFGVPIPDVIKNLIATYTGKGGGKNE